MSIASSAFRNCFRLLGLTVLSAFCVFGQPLEIQFGQFSILVSESWTAQVFHMVDQLAEWDESTHKAYVRWSKKNLQLDDTDRELLAKHAEMRRARGWGNGFEQAFLVDGSIDEAAARASAQGLLSQEEIDAEREILSHFSPMLAKLRDQQQPRIDAFKANLVAERERLLPWFEKLIAFTQTENPVEVEVFLVANSEEHSGGGEANGGRIVVEVPGPYPTSVLLHESLHILMQPYREDVRSALETTGVRWQDFNEGIVYALAPGLTEDPAVRDSLAEQVARYYMQGRPAKDTYAQSYMIATVILPDLRASIDSGETFPEFLPKAIARWKRVLPR